MPVCPSQEHVVRNATACIGGFILYLRKQGRLSDQEKVYLNLQLRHIEQTLIPTPDITDVRWIA